MLVMSGICPRVRVRVRAWWVLGAVLTLWLVPLASKDVELKASGACKPREFGEFAISNVQRNHSHVSNPHGTLENDFIDLICD